MRLPKWKAIVAFTLVFSLVGFTTLYAADSVATTGDQQAIVLEEEDASGGAVLLDVLLVRPISFGGMLLGCAVWLVAAPFALMADGTEGLGKVSDTLVVGPAKYTFKRSVGKQM